MNRFFLTKKIEYKFETIYQGWRFPVPVHPYFFRPPVSVSHILHGKLYTPNDRNTLDLLLFLAKNISPNIIFRNGPTECRQPCAAN